MEMDNGANKEGKNEGMKRTYGLERGIHATWSKGTPRCVVQEPPLEMSLTQDKTQSRHLGYYPPKIRPR